MGYDQGGFATVGIMPTLLVHHATLLVMMDDTRRCFPDGAVYIQDNIIRQVGPTADLPAEADRVIDARGMVILPGLVNTHHHLFQSLTWALPGAQDVEFQDWIRILYPTWAHLTREALYISALVSLAEAVLSGCTTVADHLYLFPNDSCVDAVICAAEELGVRLYAGRGSISLGTSRGRFAPVSVVEDETSILADCKRVAESYHDPASYSMCRIFLAAASLFSVTPRLMPALAQLAGEHGLRLHTHLAERASEVDFCLRNFGLRPVEVMRKFGWLGSNVWFAHCVHLSHDEIMLLAATGTGVAHCPTANMRLGSGIAPIRAMLDAGVKVGLASDGSASNDSGHMMAEVRQAMLLQRVNAGPAALTAREALRMATRGGAAVLGREEIGSLVSGKAADLIGVRLDGLSFAGAQVDPLAALVFCAPSTVDLSIINGRVVVENGQLAKIDLSATIARHNELAERLLHG